MITDKGSIKVVTKVDVNVQKELSINFFIVGLITLCLGSVGIAAYLTVDILSIFNILKEPHILILVAAAAVFAFGLVLVVTYKKLLKSTAATPVRTESCEFFADCIIAEDVLYGEKVGSGKFAYGQIVNRRETKNYLFMYLNTSVATPLFKGGLSAEELDTLRSLIGLVAKGNTLDLPKYFEAAAPAVPEAPAEPAVEEPEESAVPAAPAEPETPAEPAVLAAPETEAPAEDGKREDEE